MKTVTLGSMLLVLASPVALSQAPAAKKAEAKPAAMQAPRPSAELDTLKLFTGQWACTGKTADSPLGPAHATKATVKAEKELDGFWIDGSYTETKTAENPNPIEGDFAWGYDAAGKRFVAQWHDSMGGWGEQSSAGWEGDKLVWAGHMNMGGQKVAARDTFTRKGDKQLTHLGEMELNGTWTRMSEETCNKVK